MEEIKEKCGLQITNDKVYMSTTFQAFTEMLVMNHRGEDTEEEFTYDPVCYNHTRLSNNKSMDFLTRYLSINLSHLH